jgi:uncharacterized protein (TIGR03435 family)
MRGLARIAALAATLSLGLSAQTFGVASIKPSNRNLPSPPYRNGPIELSTQDTLKGLIAQAYKIKDPDYRAAVLGGLEWTQSEYYDIVAKANAPSSRHELNVMLQALLADRFQLKLHRETKIMSGYALTADKGGAKLPPPRSDVPPDSTGVIQMGGGEFWARGATLASLAGALRLELGSPVVDETKIDGHYDFRIQFEEGSAELMARPDDSGTPARPEPGISIFTALHQLGLKLDSRKLPIEVFIIDSAERPSAN